MTIWKYAISMTETQVIQMPAGAQILHVGQQQRNLCLWAMVDPQFPCEDRTIEIVGTGNPMASRRRKYLGTAWIDPFVWHVFELLE